MQSQPEYLSLLKLFDPAMDGMILYLPHPPTWNLQALDLGW